MNKKRRVGVILIIAVIIILLSLSVYFVIRGLSPSTGNAVADNDLISRITTPARAVDAGLDLTNYNLTRTPATDNAITGSTVTEVLSNFSWLNAVIIGGVIILVIVIVWRKFKS